jgi:hypothetical protein
MIRANRKLLREGDGLRRNQKEDAKGTGQRTTHTEVPQTVRLAHANLQY